MSIIVINKIFIFSQSICQTEPNDIEYFIKKKRRKTLLEFK